MCLRRALCVAALLLVVNAGTRDTPQLDPVVRPAHVYRTVVAQGLPCLFSVAVYDSKHDVFVSASIADRKLWDAGVVRVLLAALEQCSGGAFVDVGANIGYFSLLAARLGHRVVAFEPAAASADRLAFGVAENELQHLVTVFRNGASDSTAVAFLAPAADNQGGRSMLVGDTLNQQGERVQLVRLDDVPAVMQLPRVAAVKLDVEGMEGLALLGMRAFLLHSRVPFVLVEVSAVTAQNRWAQALQMMQGLGYELYSVDAFPPETHKPVADGTRALRNGYFWLRTARRTTAETAGV